MADEKTVSIVVPVYNEEEILSRVIKEIVLNLEKSRLAFELILVENGSTDSSGDIIDELSTKDSRIHAYHLKKPNYGAALRFGYLKSIGDYCANFSVDWVDTRFLELALAKLDRNDIVVGSKNIEASIDQRSKLRRFGGLLFHKIIQFLFAIPVTDTHGIKVFRRDKVLGLIRKCRLEGQLFDTEFIIRAYKSGLSILELPVTVEERRPTRVNMLTRTWQALLQLIKLRLILLFEEYG